MVRRILMRKTGYPLGERTVIYNSYLGSNELTQQSLYFLIVPLNRSSAVFSGGAGGARAPPEFGGSQKGPHRLELLE